MLKCWKKIFRDSRMKLGAGKDINKYMNSRVEITCNGILKNSEKRIQIKM